MPRIPRSLPQTYLAFFLYICFFAVNPARAQDTTVLPQAQVGKPYSVLIGVDTENGKGQITWKLAHGDLPPGLQISVTGKLEGTPSEARNDSFVFELSASDSSQPPQSALLRFSIVILPPPLRIKAVNVTTTQLKVVSVSAAETAASDPAFSAPSTPAPVRVPESAAAPAEPTKAEPEKTQTTPQAASSSSTAVLPAKVAATDENKEWEARAIVGYHQAGAASAKFSQNFFFDFFILRSLSNHHLWEEHKWKLWGDARVASFPQQITTGIGTFATNFATQVSNLPVNQLAQGADFQTGLEYTLKKWQSPRSYYRTIGLIGYFGAMGVFQPPDSQMEIFNVPDKASLQYTAFAKQFSAAANAKYVGFVPPNRERFYRNYGFGMRVTTFDRGQPLAPPATYTLSLGEDEAITQGIFRSVVGKIDVFYPLPISGAAGKYKFLYLFGNANLRLSKATSIPTFALQNPNANGITVQPFDPNLAIVTVPTTRDTYRIGVGVDLINLIQSIANNNNVRQTPQSSGTGPGATNQ
jgi:hypothetical protein